MSYVLLGLLFLFLAWFVYGMTTKKYAPPVNSVFLISLGVSIIGWIIPDESVTNWAWPITIGVFAIVTRNFSNDVDKQGMFWNIWKDEKTLGYDSWPRWSFGLRASDPIRCPDLRTNYLDNFFWEGERMWDEAVGDKAYCKTTITFHFEAHSTVDNVQALAAFENTLPEKDRKTLWYSLEQKIGDFLKEHLRSRITVAAQEAAAGLSVGEQEILIKDYPDPLRCLVPGINWIVRSSLSVKIDVMRIA